MFVSSEKPEEWTAVLLGCPQGYWRRLSSVSLSDDILQNSWEWQIYNLQKGIGIGPKFPESTSKWGDAGRGYHIPLGGSFHLPRVREIIQPSWQHVYPMKCNKSLGVNLNLSWKIVVRYSVDSRDLGLSDYDSWFLRLVVSMPGCATFCRQDSEL